MKSQLNSSQKLAVTTLDGPVLVIAGAGSGKTRVIEYRVLELIGRNVDPGQILLLTFTRRAASQMLERAACRDPRCRRVQGGTFHSFAYRCLKQHAARIGLADFSILDDEDAQEAFGVCIGRLKLDYDKKRFPRKEALCRICSMSVNKEMPVEEVVDTYYPKFWEYTRDIQRLQQEFAAYKRQQGYLDYDDLLVACRDLLAGHEDVRTRLGRQYRYIMVDEYQDTNRVQAEILCLLGREHGNVLAVGDDAQSIYGFRGATHKNIMEFPQRFPGCKVITLEANYRSSQAILDVANAVLKNMAQKYEKDLFAAAHSSGEKPQLLFFQDSSMEAEWIAENVRQRHEQGVNLGEQAVLFRSAHVSIPLQMELSRRGIPFVVYGGMKFYETAHIKDVLCHAKLLVNMRDEISWTRALTLVEGIGPKTAARLVAAMRLAPDMPGALQVLVSEARTMKSAGRVKLLADLLSGLCGPGLNAAGMLEKINGYYLPLLKEKFEDWQDRQMDMEAVRSLAASNATLEEFLAQFALDNPEKSSVAARDQGEQASLVLSTIHSAKGLEWEEVAIIGMVDGVLPISFSLDHPEQLEEEQRLLYVALTRAKRRLWLCVHHEGNGFSGSCYNRISRFLESQRVLACLERDVHLDYDIV